MPKHMELNGTRNLSAAPQAVWDVMHNSAAIQAAIPGAEEIAWQGDSAVAVRIKVELGPVNRSFSLVAQVVEQSAPTHIKFSTNRQGVSNRVQGDLAVDLTPNGSGTTLVYAGTANLEGPLAMLDNPLTRPLVQRQIDQFFDNLARQIG